MMNVVKLVINNFNLLYGKILLLALGKVSVTRNLETYFFGTYLKTFSA